MRFYKMIRAVFAGIVKAMFRVHVHGSENIPESGGCIIAPNHISALDPIIIAASVKRPIVFMAKAELFKIPILSSLLKSLMAFPVNRKDGDISAIKKSLSIIKRGDPLCVFPQGTRCAGCELSETREKIKSGVGLMANKTEAPIIPVYIKTKKNKISLFGKTDIFFGHPIVAEEYMLFEGKNKYSDVADLVFDRILLIKSESEVS